MFKQGLAIIKSESLIYLILGVIIFWDGLGGFDQGREFIFGGGTVSTPQNGIHNFDMLALWNGMLLLRALEQYCHISLFSNISPTEQPRNRKITSIVVAS